MKKLLQIFTAITILGATVFAQDATITIPDMTSSSGIEVLVPLNITALSNVGSASIRVQYDPGVLTYIGIEDDSFGGVIENATGGEVRTSWFSLSPIDLSGLVYNIRFDYHGGASDLTFTLVQITNDLSQPYDIATVSGSIEEAGESIEVTAPNGGEGWLVGESQNITWTSSGVTNVMLEYSANNGGAWNTIEASIASSGSYSWAVPDDATTQALVRVSDAGAGSASDQSDAVFSIIGEPDANVWIPDTSFVAGGEILIPVKIDQLDNVGSSSLRIQYNTDNLTFISIENDAFGGVIVNDDAGVIRTSWFSLNPVDLAGKIYDLKFQYNGGSGDFAFVETNQFTNDLSQPYIVTFTDGSISELTSSIEVITPNGGEDWLVGTAMNIAWNSSNVANVMIEYSTDAGASWNTVIASTPNTGNFVWTVPDTPTSEGLVFISDASNIAINDQSDEMFTITPTPKPPVVGDIPDQTIQEGESFDPINLDDFVTDEDNTVDEIMWTHSGAVELTVEIDVNRVATITHPGGQWSGSETITFTATDPELQSDSSAATFTVTAVNQPPVVGDIPDQSIENGSFETINLDDFVTDPDNDASEMTWEATGQTELSVSITDRVATINIPDEEWEGTETITFTATDPGGLSDSDDAMFSRIVVGIEDELEIPNEFALDQNYPNPFNPSTTISYDLKVSSEVTLRVYNMVGQEVATLVNENKNAGSYNVIFDAADVTTGVYFYSISVLGSDGSKFINTRKMILMK